MISGGFCGAEAYFLYLPCCNSLHLSVMKTRNKNGLKKTRKWFEKTRKEFENNKINQQNLAQS